MVFSSIFFLFFYLPAVLVSYRLVPAKLRNLHLLLVSLFFYAWGEGFYVLLMLLVVLANYFFGLLLDGQHDQRHRRWILTGGIVVSLMPLVFFKYSGFLLQNLGSLINFLPADLVHHSDTLHLPLGISFFTFQALSYLIDTYKRTTPPQGNPINLGLYIALFPQLIAGPIVRYHDIVKQIQHRAVSAEDFAYGVQRFITGLAKKVLLANTLGEMADIVFGMEPGTVSTVAVWIGGVSYMLQIYYDFSGYSDMAIGLGRMFGFTFLENFNYPYISTSIREFWRRWHISLSNWFRDYLYIPLGGNRFGELRTMANLFIVFLLCGLWHGASWTFICWGLYHGFFLAAERTRWGTIITRLPLFCRHGYTLLVVLIGWIFFRAETLDQGLELITILFGHNLLNALPYKVILALDPLFCTTFALGLLLMFPVVPKLLSRLEGLSEPLTVTIHRGCLVVLFILSCASLATGVYNPFIYFRF